MSANPAIQDACRSLAAFHEYEALASLLAHMGHTVSVEYPLYLSVTTPSGERCELSKNDDDEWTVSASAEDHESITVEDDDPSGELIDRLADAIATFTERGRYKTAAERRQADRNEATARNRR